MPPANRLDWDAHKPMIVKHYWVQNKSLDKVRDMMERLHGFSATKRQYKRQLKDWGLSKNTNADDMKAMLLIQRYRRRHLKKETRFFRHGKEVRPEQLTRFARRFHIDESTLSLSQVVTPPSIRFCTPEVDGSTRSLPSALDMARMVTTTSEIADEERLESTDSETGSPATMTGFSRPGQYSGWARPMSSSPTPWQLDTQVLPAPLASTSTSLDARFGHDSVAPYGPNAQGTGPSLPAGFDPMLHLDTIESLDETTNVADNFSTQANSTQCWESFNYFQTSHQDAEPVRSSAMDVSRDVDPHRNHTATVDAAAWMNGHPQGSFPLPIVASRYQSTRHEPSETYNFQTPSINTINNARMDQDSFRGYTRLHMAVIEDNVETAEMLLKYGADPNASAIGGITPLHYAAFQRNARLVAVLKNHGARLDAMDDNNRSILYFAVCSRDRLEHKLSYFKQGNQNDPHTRTDPHTDEDTMKVMDTLYDSPSEWHLLSESLTQSDSKGVTPLMAAAETGFEGTVSKLIKRGAKPNAKDNSDYTALKYAASGVHGRLVRLLLEADPRVQKREVKYMLKLAVGNLLTSQPVPAGLQRRQPGSVSWPDSAYNHDAVLIAAEMASLYRRLGVLDDVIGLAKRKRQTIVVEYLEAAKVELKP